MAYSCGATAQAERGWCLSVHLTAVLLMSSSGNSCALPNVRIRSTPGRVLSSVLGNGGTLELEKALGMRSVAPKQPKRAHDTAQRTIPALKSPIVFNACACVRAC